MNTFESLKKHSVIVADTGDISQIKKIKPQDATTNPSLILQAAGKPEYRHLIEQAVTWAKKRNGTLAEQAENFMDRLAINFGIEILKSIPGYISTEIDASLSFNTAETCRRAEKIIQIYEGEGVPRDRVLIKIAATWEGIKAATELKNKNINSNMTLLFSMTQATACSSNGLFLISPFVGRILDWHKSRKPDADFSKENDPGVQFVKSVYTYYKTYKYDTIVMAASFRNTDEILALAGCDRLTISPALIQELEQKTEPVTVTLNNPPEIPKRMPYCIEADFRSMLNDDLMATEKLAEGIFKFKQDYQTLQKQILTDYFS